MVEWVATRERIHCRCRSCSLLGTRPHYCVPPFVTPLPHCALSVRVRVCVSGRLLSRHASQVDGFLASLLLRMLRIFLLNERISVSAFCLMTIQASRLFLFTCFDMIFTKIFRSICSAAC